MDAAAMRTEFLSKHCGRLPVLHALDLAVHAGAVFGRPGRVFVAVRAAALVGAASDRRHVVTVDATTRTGPGKGDACP
jgi:hypothetical protein